jgi:hypothetical protein
MDESIARYLYSNIVDDLRNGRPLPPGLASSLDVFPVIDRLRVVVEEADVPMLLATAREQWSDSAALAVSLLRRYARRADVRVTLRELWRSCTAFAPRYELLFRLLDDPDLPLGWHREIYEFVQSHRSEFLDASVVWAGGVGHLLDRVRSRLADASFAREKMWVYLVIATVSDDRAAVAALIKPYSGLADFTGSVAGELMTSLLI